MIANSNEGQHICFKTKIFLFH